MSKYVPLFFSVSVIFTDIMHGVERNKQRYVELYFPAKNRTVYVMLKLGSNPQIPPVAAFLVRLRQKHYE